MQHCGSRAVGTGNTVDLYLLDTRLPDGSGIDLCRQIRSEDLYSPIIFYSGEARPEMIEEAMKAGAQAYLKKPIDPFEVGETIAGLISTT